MHQPHLSPFPGEIWDMPADFWPHVNQQEWFESLTAARKQFTVKTAAPASADTARISGAFKQAWPLPGEAAQLKNIELSFILSKSGHYEITAFTANLEADSRRLPLSLDTDTPEYARFCGVSPETEMMDHLFPPDFRNRGVKTLLGQTFLGKTLFEQFALIPGAEGEDTVQYQFGFSLPDDFPALLRIPLRSAGMLIDCTLSDTHDGAEYYLRQSISVSGTLGKNAEYPFLFRYTGDGTYEIGIFAPEDQGLPGPADLLEWLGLADTAQEFKAFTHQYSALSSFKLTAFRLIADPEQKKITGASMAGNVTIDGRIFLFHASFPGPAFAIRLSAATPIPLGGFLNAFLPDTQGLPLHLNIADLHLHLDVQAGIIGGGIVFKDIWEWEIGTTRVQLESLGLGFEVAEKRLQSLRIQGGMRLADLDFSCSAQRYIQDQKAGWALEAYLAKQEKIALAPLIRKLAPIFGLAVPEHLPEIFLYDLSFEYDTLSGDFSFGASCSAENLIENIPAAELSITLSRTVENDGSNTRKVLKIKLEGEIEIAGNTVTFDAELGNPDWYLEAEWKQEDGKGIYLPGWLSQTFPELSREQMPEELARHLTLSALRLQYKAKSKRFLLTAANENGIQIAVVIARTDKGWAAAAGAGFQKTEALPRFGELLKAGGKTLQLSDAWALFVWLPEGMKTPDSLFEDLQFPVTTRQLTRGLVLSAKLDLKQDPAFDALRNSAETSSLRIQGEIGKNSSGFFLSLSLMLNTLSFDTGAQKRLVIRDARVRMEIAPASLSIKADGKFDIAVQKEIWEVSAGFDLSNTGISVRGGVIFPDKGIALFGLEQVRLKEVFALLGVSFTPPGVRLGLQGKMTFRENQQQPDALAIVMDIPGPVPKVNYFALSITRLDVADILRSIQGHQNSKYIPRNIFGVEAFSIQWAAGKVDLPDGTQATAGLSMHGLIHIHTWTGYFAFSADQKNISGRGELDPVTSEGFRLTGKGTQGFKMLHVREGNQWIAVDNTRELPANAKTEMKQVVKPGGASIQFNSAGPLYLAANFEVKVLDLLEFKTNIRIDEHGMDFKLETHSPVFNLELSCVWKKDKSLQAKGSYSGGLLWDFGWVLGKVGIGVEGKLEIVSGSKFKFLFNYDVKIGIIPVPGLKIEVNHAPKNFGDVLGIAVENIWRNIPIVRVTEMLIETIFSGKKAGPRAKGKKAAIKPSPKHSFTSESLTALEDLYQHIQPPPRARGKKETENPVSPLHTMQPAERKALIQRLETEGKAEAARLRELAQVIPAVNAEKRAAVQANRDMRKAAIQQATADFKDSSGALRMAIGRSWEPILADWKHAFRAHQQAQAQYHRGDIPAEAAAAAAHQLAEWDARSEHLLEPLKADPFPQAGEDVQGLRAEAVTLHAAQYRTLLQARWLQEWILDYARKSTETPTV